jgi:hypothetical protein
VPLLREHLPVGRASTASLVDIGRKVVERSVPPPVARPADARRTARICTTRRWLFGPAMQAGRSVRLLLPGALRAKVPPLILGMARHRSACASSVIAAQRLRAALDDPQHQRRHRGACSTRSASRWSRSPAPAAAARCACT